MIKIRLVALLLGLIASNVLFAQKEDSLQVEKELLILKKLDKEYWKHEDITVLEKVQAENTLTTKIGKSGLLIGLAEAKFSQYKKLKRSKAPIAQLDSLHAEALKLYDAGIQMCDQCRNTYRVRRLYFLQETRDKVVYKDELLSMKKLGYREERAGIALGFTSQQGKDTWMGGSFAANEDYTPNMKINTTSDSATGAKKYNRKVGFRGSLVNFEILWNLNRKATDVNFSLLRLSAPFYLDITKFGAMRYLADEKAYWYYRPEIGFGWNIVSFGYAYNHIFAKAQRDKKERHLFFVKVSYPLVK